jgi:hypothetical protein
MGSGAEALLRWPARRLMIAEATMSQVRTFVISLSPPHAQACSPEELPRSAGMRAFSPLGAMLSYSRLRFCKIPSFVAHPRRRCLLRMSRVRDGAAPTASCALDADMRALLERGGVFHQTAPGLDAVPFGPLLWVSLQNSI